MKANIINETTVYYSDLEKIFKKSTWDQIVLVMPLHVGLEIYAWNSHTLPSIYYDCTNVWAGLLSIAVEEQIKLSIDRIMLVFYLKLPCRQYCQRDKMLAYTDGLCSQRPRNLLGFKIRLKVGN